MKNNPDFWDSYASGFDAIYGTKNSLFNDLINKLFRKTMRIRFEKTIQAVPQGNVSVLDIGCGPGHYCFALAQKVTGPIIGLDFSRNMIELAVQHAHELNLEHKVDFRIGDILGFKSPVKYDYSVMMGFIEYFNDPETILRKAISLTNKMLFISFPVANGLLAFQRKIRYKRKCFLKLYSHNDIVDLMKRLNVRSYQIERIHRDFFVIVTPG